MTVSVTRRKRENSTEMDSWQLSPFRDLGSGMRNHTEELDPKTEEQEVWKNSAHEGFHHSIMRNEAWLDA